MKTTAKKPMSQSRIKMMVAVKRAADQVRAEHLAIARAAHGTIAAAATDLGISESTAYRILRDVR